MQLTNGSRLGPYEVLAAIGSGGMGEVYRARDTRLDRDVAVKVLSKRLARDADALARFEREAKAVAALSHPNILSIHDFAIQDGMPYTVTELLEGESLRSRLELGPLPWREAGAIGVAIAEGLSAAHAKGIVHRDLKPENLFLLQDGRVKILDFGLAKPAHEAWASAHAVDGSSPTVATPSEGGAVLGTLGYMSPEQARGLPVGTTSDIFSLGCVLYELVTGHRAFAGPTPTDTLAAVLHEPPGAISDSGRHVPHDLSRIIMHCLEKDAAVRFQSVRDVAFALRSVLNDSAVDVVGGRAARTKTRAVAVLPFINDSGDAELDYLAEGLTESLINSLVQVPRLRVVPRTMVFRYKGQTIDPHRLGVELNATTLVTGRLVARASTLSVQAEMIDVSSQAQLWGQRYMRPVSDLFAVQEELAREIAAALRGRLSRRTKKKSAGTRPPNSAAYQDYLRGRYYWNRWTPDGFGKAIRLFESAIEKDPAFAPAWAGLADALGASGYFGFQPARDAMPRARAAAERAIQIDPSLSDGHAGRAICLFFWDWNLPEAERAFARALELNPRNALARVYHSLLLSAQGRSEEAIGEAREAEKLDPVAPVMMASVAWALHFGGRHEEALAQAHRILDLDPHSVEAQAMLVGCHEENGDYEAATRHAEPWLQALGLPTGHAVHLADRYREGGATAYWRARLEMLEQACACGGPMAVAAAGVHVHLGEFGQALDILERACDDHNPVLVFLAAEPAFGPLHGHPRFEALRERVGLPLVPPHPLPGLSAR